MSSPGSRGSSATERILERLASRGVIGGEDVDEARTILEEESGLEEIFGELYRVTYWAGDDIYTDADEYQWRVNNLHGALRDAMDKVEEHLGPQGKVRALRTLERKAEEEIRNRPDDNANEEGEYEADEGPRTPHALLSEVRFALARRPGIADRGRLVRALSEEAPERAAYLLSCLSSEERTEVAPDDLAPLLNCPYGNLRRQAFDMMPQLKGDHEHETVQEMEGKGRRP